MVDCCCYPCCPPMVLGQACNGGCCCRYRPPAPIPLQPPCCQGPFPTFYKPRPCCPQPCVTPPMCWCHPCWAPPPCCRPGAYNPRRIPPGVCPPPCCCQPCKFPPRCMPPPCRPCRRPCCPPPVLLPIPAYQPKGCCMCVPLSEYCPSCSGRPPPPNKVECELLPPENPNPNPPCPVPNSQQPNFCQQQPGPQNDNCCPNANASPPTCRTMNIELKLTEEMESCPC